MITKAGVQFIALKGFRGIVNQAIYVQTLGCDIRALYLPIARCLFRPISASSLVLLIVKLSAFCEELGGVRRLKTKEFDALFAISKNIQQLCVKQDLVFLLILSNIYKKSSQSKFETIFWKDAYLRLTEKPTSLCEGRGLAL